MNVWKKLKDHFSKPAPPAGPTMRNRPGGLAWVKGIPELDGRVVTTVRIHSSDFWTIDPPQVYTSQYHRTGINGVKASPGDTVTTIGIVDRCLEPIRDIGDHERDESAAWLPPVPAPRVEYDAAKHADAYPFMQGGA